MLERIKLKCLRVIVYHHCNALVFENAEIYFTFSPVSTQISFSSAAATLKHHIPSNTTPFLNKIFPDTISSDAYAPAWLVPTPAIFLLLQKSNTSNPIDAAPGHETSRHRTLRHQPSMNFYAKSISADNSFLTEFHPGKTYFADSF